MPPLDGLRITTPFPAQADGAFTKAALSLRSRQPVQRIEVKSLQDKLCAQKLVVDFIPGQPERWTDIRKDTGGPPVV